MVFPPLGERRRRRSKDILFYRSMYPTYSIHYVIRVHFFLYGFSSSRSTFFFAIFLLFPRGRDFLSVFVVTFCLLSSRRRQQHPKRRRRATAEPRETLSLSPFSFSPRRAERVVGKSSESRRIRRDISKYNNGRRTKNDGQRSRERGGRRRRRDRASSGEGIITLLLLKHHRFFRF